MKICVVGWYFDRDFLNSLRDVSRMYPAMIISHRPQMELKPEVYRDLKIHCVENVGLEFGAYAFYLKCIWDERSSVLFTHDDTRVSSIGVFDRIADIPHDCAYIFRDAAEEKANGGKHGRAIFCKPAFLHRLKTKGGFWFDKRNKGYSGAGMARPYPDMDFNEGINQFHKYLGRLRDERIGFDVVNRVFFSEYECGRRGTWRHKEKEKARYGSA